MATLSLTRAEPAASMPRVVWRRGLLGEKVRERGRELVELGLCNHERVHGSPPTLRFTNNREMWVKS